MKIIKAQVKKIESRAFIHGEKVYSGILELLVDEIPEVAFRQINNFYYGEKDGYVRLYEHKPGSRNGFGGAEITLTMEGGTERTFIGTLWDPFHVPEFIPPCRCIAITTDPAAMERGHTFTYGKITEELFRSILEDIGENIQIMDWM